MLDAVGMAEINKIFAVTDALGIHREALVIPPDVPHMVEALEDSLAVDLFSPPRADWIRGDDAYLRDASNR